MPKYDFNKLLEPYEFQEEYFEEVKQLIIDSITYFNQFENMLDNKYKYYTLRLSTKEKENLIKKLKNNLEEYRIIRGDFL